VREMKKRILVIGENKESIDFNQFLSLYQWEFESSNNIQEDWDLVIIEGNDIKKIFSDAQRIRNSDESLGILFVTKQENSKYVTKLISKINGYGKIKVIYFHESGNNKILESVSEMLYPELPNHREDIGVVLPMFNEAEREKHVKTFIKKLSALQEKGYTNISLYMINDGSSDGTSLMINKIIKDMENEDDLVRYKRFLQVKELLVNTRKAGTYIEGIRSIDADIIVFSDADDSFDIQDISRMINVVEEGYFDMVVGTKDNTIEDRSFKRKMVSFFKRLMTYPLLPKGVKDAQTGLKVMNSTVANYIIPYLDVKRGLAIDLEILYISKKLNFRVLQMEVECMEREGSHVDLIKDSIRYIGSIFSILVSGFGQRKNIRVRR
jgi:hypothetical protein